MEDSRKSVSVKPVYDPEIITEKIFTIRGQKVILDFDLAEIYGVPTKRLNEQIKRNINRFPSDFMFQLTREEVSKILEAKSQSMHERMNRSQIATGSKVCLKRLTTFWPLKTNRNAKSASRPEKNVQPMR